MDYSDLVFDDLLKFPELSSKILKNHLESELFNIQEFPVSIKTENLENLVNEAYEVTIKSEPKDNSDNIQEFNQFPIVLDSFSISQTDILFFNTELSKIKQEFQVSNKKGSPKAPKNDHQTQNPSLKCDKCGKSFINRKKIAAHMKVHKSLTKCKICNSMLKPDSIYGHMRTIHPTTNEKFNCTICGKTFKDKIFLKNHENTHDKKYECKFCKRKFSQKHELSTHVSKKHENPNSFECKTCGKYFNFKKVLKSHEKTHDSNRQKAHKCGQCDYASDNSHHLIRHMNVHKKKRESNA